MLFRAVTRLYDARQEARALLRALLPGGTCKPCSIKILLGTFVPYENGRIVRCVVRLAEVLISRNSSGIELPIRVGGSL